VIIGFVDAFGVAVEVVAKCLAWGVGDGDLAALFIN
jgi:hypothetical protein